MDSNEEKLARLVVTLVRDDVISYFDQLLAGTLVSQYDMAIFADLGSEPVIAREKVLELLPYIVDSTIEGMLEAIKQSETFDLVLKDPDGDSSVTEVVDSFYGEYKGRDGWVERFSAQRQGKYVQMINADISGIVQQVAADPSWPPKGRWIYRKDPCVLTAGGAYQVPRRALSNAWMSGQWLEAACTCRGLAAGPGAM